MSTGSDRTPVEAWRLADLPDQSGRTVVVTGPSLGGLGHHTALELARRGARVVLAGRAPAKLEATATAITGEVPSAVVERLVVDLADLAAVRRAGAAASRLGPVDVLVNNAGVMATARQRTSEGLDLQVATNHVGPFLLTGLLLPQLVASGAGRVVTVSSLFHRFASRPPALGPGATSRVYRRWHTYAGTKLANLLFTAELDRRCRDAGLPVQAMAAHPGFAGTHLTANGRFGRASGGVPGLVDRGARLIAQSAAAGAWPTLMAATADLPGGSFCGPSGSGELNGRPHVTTPSQAAREPRAAAALWESSQRVAGLEYP